MAEILDIIRSDDIGAYLELFQDKRIKSDGLTSHLNLAQNHSASMIIQYLLDTIDNLAKQSVANLASEIDDRLARETVIASVHAHNEHCICDTCFF